MSLTDAFLYVIQYLLHTNNQRRQKEKERNQKKKKKKKKKIVKNKTGQNVGLKK